MIDYLKSLLESKSRLSIQSLLVITVCTIVTQVWKGCEGGGKFCKVTVSSKEITHIKPNKGNKIHDK